MLKQQVIQPSESPWSSPVVIVTKKNGEVRFCCDYRKINKITKKDSWPLPRIDEALDTLAGSTCFTSLDMFSGYWMLPLSAQAREKTAFITHMGLYEWKVLPFGLTAAPAKYQRTMDTLLRKLKWKTCCLYLDDVCVFGKTFWEQLDRLRQVILTLDEVNMKMNPRKCFFGMDELEYLGHRVSKEGIKPAESKVQKIKEYQPPRSVTQLRSFLGLAGYYRNFVENFAKNANPLFKLLKQNQEFVWDDACQKAFEYLKNALISEPVCVHYDEKKEHGIFVDACAKGIGAILKQEEIDDDGKKTWRVVSYWGRALLDAETRYSATELELLGLVNACHHFRCYIHGKQVKVFTDHRALLSLTGKGLAQGGVYNRRINTWQMKLADFDLEIVYRPGKTHQDADAISRMDQDKEQSKEGDEDKIFFNPVVNLDLFVPPDLDLQNSQKNDPFICYKMKQMLKGGGSVHRRFYFDKNSNILYRKIKKKDELTTFAPVVPMAKRETVLKHFHDSVIGGHRGTRKTKSAIRRCPLWWPSMNKEIEKYIKTCEECQRKKPSLQITPPPISLFKQLPYASMKPFQCIAIDMMDLNHNPSYGHRYIILGIDLLTGYVEAAPLKAPTAAAVSNFLMKHFILQGNCPEWILSDRAPNLKGGSMETICKKLNIKRVLTARYNPRCNGKCERANGSFKRILKFYVSKGQKDWSRWIDIVAFIMNTTSSESTGYSPYFLARGKEPRFAINNETGQVIFDPEELLRKPLNDLDMERHYQKARENLIKNALKWANKEPSKTIPIFEEGEQVLILVMRKTAGLVHSLLDIYEGPFTVVRKFDFHTYQVVNNQDSNDIRTCPVNQLKRFHLRPPTAIVEHKFIDKKEKESSPSDEGEDDEI